MQSVNKNVKNKKLMMGVGVAFALAAVFGVGYWTANKLSADTTNFVFDVTPGTISIDAPDVIDFGSVSTAGVDQNVDKQTTTEQFLVYDYKGADAGYYTTLQASTLTGVDGSGNVVGTIPANNIFVYTNTDQATLSTGTANTDVKVNPSLKTVYTAIDGAKTYILRDTGNNSGRVGLYYDLPKFRILVPAYQAVGDYSEAGVLTFTLIEN